MKGLDTVESLSGGARGSIFLLKKVLPKLGLFYEVDKSSTIPTVGIPRVWNKRTPLNKRSPLENLAKRIIVAPFLPTEAACAFHRGRRGQATNGNCGFEIGSCELAISAAARVSSRSSVAATARPHRPWQRVELMRVLHSRLFLLLHVAGKIS